MGFRAFMAGERGSLARLIGTVIFLGLLPFAVGCFPKTVLQPPSIPSQMPGSAVQSQLLTQYDRWKGVPYRVGGEDRYGFDCSGLVCVVYRDAFRMNLPRTSVEQSRLGLGVERNDIRPGDILYFIDHGNDHVGIAVESRRFMHSSTTKGVMISELDGYWAPRLLRVRRLLNDSR